jgi:hypothetical protein
MIHPRFGRIDFRRDDLDLMKLRQITEEGGFYLELTPEGQKEFCGLELPLCNDINVESAKKKRNKVAL